MKDNSKIEYVNLYELFNSKIEKIFNKYYDLPFVNQGYELRTKVAKNCILFISANPSGTDKNNAVKSYDIYNIKNHFFDKMVKISDKYNLPWGEIDLICLIEKTLSNIKNNFYKKNSPVRCKEFVSELMNITKQMISEIQPKFIVVSSAFASDEIIKLYNLNPEDNNQFIIDEKSKLKIPIEFTGMFSGQGQITKYDYNRLVNIIGIRLNIFEK